MTERGDQQSSVNSPFPIGNINRLLVRIASLFVGEDNVGGEADIVGWLKWVHDSTIGEIYSIVSDIKQK